MQDKDTAKQEKEAAKLEKLEKKKAVAAEKAAAKAAAKAAKDAAKAEVQYTSILCLLWAHCFEFTAGCSTIFDDYVYTRRGLNRGLSNFVYGCVHFSETRGKEEWKVSECSTR